MNLFSDAYHRYLKRRKSKSGDAAKKIKKWRYESEMEFLRPERISKTNIESAIMSDDNDDDSETATFSASVHSPRPRSISTSDLENAIFLGHLRKKHLRLILKHQGLPRKMRFLKT